MRQPFQILVMPFRRTNNGFEFAVFRRSDGDYWQGIAGGGEGDESPEDAAKREAGEEAGIPLTAPFFRLQTTSSIPVHNFDERSSWPTHLLVIPEFSFAVDCTEVELEISAEHVEASWGQYQDVYDLLKWDSNRTALWELQERLRSQTLLELTSN